MGHLCSLSRVLVLSTPFLALTPTSCLCHSSVIDLVMLNSSLNSSYLSQQPFLLLQPSSLTNFYQSSLVLRFTSLFFALYFPLHLCFSRSDLAPSIFNFASFLSLIFSHVLYNFFMLSYKFRYVDKISSCPASESSMSPKALILLLNSMFYLYLIPSLCSLLRSNLYFTFFLPSGLGNFLLILVLTR